MKLYCVNIQIMFDIEAIALRDEELVCPRPSSLTFSPSRLEEFPVGRSTSLVDRKPLLHGHQIDLCEVEAT